MKPDELRAIIKQPESDVLEFKTRLPDPRLTARLISAFANTKGGTLIVGVKEGGEVVGIDEPTRAQRILEQAAKWISPSVVIQSDIVNLDGRTVLVATIQKGLESPHLVDGQVLQRVGDRITPITSKALYNNIQERATSIDDVLSGVRRLSMIIEQLNKELIAAKSWRSKVADMVLGGVIGALISIALAILLGIG